MGRRSLQGGRWNVAAPPRHKPGEMPNCHNSHETGNSQALFMYFLQSRSTLKETVPEWAKGGFIATSAGRSDGAGTVPERPATKDGIALRDFRAMSPISGKCVYSHLWFRSGRRRKRDPAGPEDGQ